MSLDKFPTTLFVTKATSFITNYSVRIESPQVINEYHYNLFNYSYNIHTISKGFIHVNALGGGHTHTHTRPAQKRFLETRRVPAFGWRTPGLKISLRFKNHKPYTTSKHQVTQKLESYTETCA